MQFSALNRASTWLLGLTGLGMSLCLAAFASGPTRDVTQGQQPMNKSCASFLHDIVDNANSYQSIRPSITLYPTTRDHEDNSSVINVHKWIGGVSVGHDNTPPFQGLTKLRRGCLLFQANSNASGNAKAAVLYDSNGTKVKTYAGKWFCKLNDPHPVGVTPDWKDVPSICGVWVVWYQHENVQRRYEHVLANGENPETALVKFQAQIRADLTAKGVPVAVIDKFLVAQKGTGPWFPCAQTGCCRAFD